MSVKRKKPASSASRKARAGKAAAKGSRSSSSAKPRAAKARPKAAQAGKSAAKTRPAKSAQRKAAAPKRAAKPKAAARTKAKAKAPAKRAAKALRKTRSAGAASPGAPAVRPAPAEQDFVGFAPARAEDEPFALHDAADKTTGAPAAAPKYAAGSAGKGGAEAGDGHVGPPRPSKLVPTNAVHTTKRRTKSNFWQSPTFGATAAVFVLAMLVIGYRPEPPEVAPLEQRADAGPASDAPSESAAAPISDPVQAAPDRPWPPKAEPARSADTQTRPAQVAAAPADTMQAAASPAGPVAAHPAASSDSFWSGLDIRELIEMERILARLDLEPSHADGIVDHRTESAIRMYQQIAGLPIDGKPTAELLDDMRAVVKMLDGAN